MSDTIITANRAARFDPIVMTARLDEQSQAIFDRLRRAHFPPALNVVPAHVTLFHHLPGASFAAIAADVTRACASRAPMRFVATATRFLGRGVAFVIDCPPLASLRRALAAPWWADLTPQDRNGFKPHVTVQNKASTEAARALRPSLEALLPLHGVVEGLRLWHYRDGPWEDAGVFPFASTGEAVTP